MTSNKDNENCSMDLNYPNKNSKKFWNGPNVIKLLSVLNKNHENCSIDLILLLNYPNKILELAFCCKTFKCPK